MPWGDLFLGVPISFCGIYIFLIIVSILHICYICTLDEWHVSSHITFYQETFFQETILIEIQKSMISLCHSEFTPVSYYKPRY